MPLAGLYIAITLEQTVTCPPPRPGTDTLPPQGVPYPYGTPQPGDPQVC